MIEILTAVMLIAIIVERCTDFLFSVDLLNKLDKLITQVSLKKISAIIIGLILAFTVNIDIVSLILEKQNSSVIGYILTGILFAGGANLVSDVIKIFTSSKNKIINKKKEV